MPSKPLELPLKVAKAFARDMQAFFEEENQLKRDEIASRQLHALWAFQGPREKRLRLADVKEMFLQMRDHG
jgi:hypothetical protein